MTESAPMEDWTVGAETILVRVCADCGSTWYLPRDLCPSCGSESVGARPSAGAGVCAAVTRFAARDDRPPRAFCLIDLDEGARMMARCDPALREGDRAAASYADGLPYFVASDG